MSGMNLEVWFPQQNEASVFLESSVVDTDEERFLEVSLFALFATRQMANLRGEWVAESLAAALMTLDLERPIEDAREKLGDVRLVTPSGTGGRKGFTAELRPEKRGFFKMHPRGFGLLGKGVAYYAPTSTLALLAYLLGRRSGDKEYLAALTSTAKLVGHAGARGAITITSSAPLAMEAAAAGWAAVAEAEIVSEHGVDGEDDLDESASDGVVLAGAQLASQHGVDVAELANAIIGRMAAARPPDGDPEEVVVYPVDALRGLCAVEFVAAAMVEDTRLDQAVARSSAAPSDVAATDNLGNVAQRVLEEQGLTPVVDALVVLITTDDIDEALRA